MSFVSTSALLLFTLAHVAKGSSFLSRAQGMGVETMDAELQSTIMRKIEDMLGDGAWKIDIRLKQIQEHLQTTFKAMPKNENGKLDHAAVRYTLHSYFVQRHGWYVRGLSDAGESFNSNSSQGTLQDRVEEFVQGVFEQKLGAHGLNLRELSVLAATFENLVREEVAQRFSATLQVLNMSDFEEWDAQQVDDVLDAYMMSYITRIDYLKAKTGAINILRERMTKVYPTWEATRVFMHDVSAQHGGHRKTYLTRSEIEDVLEQIGDQYGRFQDRECRELKSKLLALEDRSIGFNGSGRVRMTDFYGSNLQEGNWQFSETRDYLDQNGILDIHDPSIPRMVIPNYINSPTNCLAGSKYYSVCCMNECEDLLDDIEHRFKAPSAPPADIVKFVSSLPSSTVPAIRVLQPMLVERLETIANHHGGKVPLHGRLFMQWMHHVYPRECPYPHVSGTTRPQRTREYMQQTDRSATHRAEALHQEHKMLVAKQSSSEASGSEECTEWSHIEELYVSGAAVDKQSFHPFRPLAYVSMAVAAASMMAKRVLSSGITSFAVGTGGKDIFV